ncbi:MAG: protease PrsW [Chloroflexi bacterium]|nr:MAG: protease PrsW [Chloroflexota bacterium]
MEGLVGFILSVISGFGPMFFLAGLIYWLDRYEKEPKLLLGGVFGWGAIVAVIGALILQIFLGQSVLRLTGSEMMEEIFGSSLFAPVTEEIFKGLAVLLVFLFFRHEFDSILDGIVYAAIVALGFAATEDVLYYFSAYMESGLGGMAALVFLRLVIFGWQHAFFTAFIGIGLAMARLNHSRLVKIGAPLVGLFLAMFMHSLHNSLLTFLSGFAGLTIASLVAWTGWLFMFGFIVSLIYREKAWLAEYLKDEVSIQTITAEQYRSASTFFGQTQAHLAALSSGKYRATTHFYQLCGELAHKKRQLATMGEEGENSRRVERIRSELVRLSLFIE